MSNIYNVQFKEQHTNDFDLYTKSIGRRKKAEEKIERTPIPMRSGDLIIHTGEYENYERQMVFTSVHNDDLSEIYAWLDGYGILRTDQDEGGFFYASVYGEIEREATAPDMNELTVTFLVEPFFYLDDGDLLITTTTTTSVRNPGTAKSRPYIKVYGTGDITLAVNGKQVELKGVEGSIVMDTERLVCYKGKENMGRKMKGDYIKFDTGMNAIAWNGNATKVEVIGRWCDL